MAEADLARRALLRGQSAAAARPLRPPWALPEARFVEACTRCGDCIGVCPEAIIVRGDGGFPEVDFRRGACTFCGACVEACAPRALRELDADPWDLTARVGGACLARHGVHCQTCRDICDVLAVSFVHRRAVPEPVIDAAACTGCGACVAACPAEAIGMRHGANP
jgi:ferredoxin-type protein NapF